jgi:hypothetical protein
MRSPPAESALGDFIVPLVVLLPAAYFVWFALAPWFVFPAAILSASLSHWIFADAVMEVVQHGVVLDITLRESPGMAANAAPIGGHGLASAAQLRIYAPPLGAGLPLFLAMALASDASVARHLFNVGAGMILLSLGQTVSILFKIAATIFSRSPPAGSVDALCSTDCLWTVVYTAQYFTYMILPGLLPVLVWVLLYRPYAASLLDVIRQRYRHEVNQP